MLWAIGLQYIAVNARYGALTTTATAPANPNMSGALH
jgi:hypothetical protein